MRKKWIERVIRFLIRFVCYSALLYTDRLSVGFSLLELRSALLYTQNKCSDGPVIVLNRFPIGTVLCYSALLYINHLLLVDLWYSIEICFE